MKKTIYDITKTTEEIRDLLIEKNTAYGDTALNPINVFSQLNPIEAICARLDDKLARIKNKGINDETEDTVKDITGYLILLMIQIKRDSEEKRLSKVILNGQTI
jgi:hypothetical protein